MVISFLEEMINYKIENKVVDLCRHGKEDEEIYKEFMEINNELIPHLLKTQGKLLDLA